MTRSMFVIPLLILCILAVLSIVAYVFTTKQQKRLFTDETYFAKITGGSFMMGDAVGDLPEFCRPVHKVTLSDFLMAKYHVTNAEVVRVFNKAFKKGLVDITEKGIVLNGHNNELLVGFTIEPPVESLPSEIAFDGNKLTVVPGREHHPCAFISWYGAVVYCNYVSELHGLQPVYDMKTWKADMSKNGYRLPTEAEYEFVASNGGKELKYPWGDDMPSFNGKPAANVADVSAENYFTPLKIWWRFEGLLPFKDYNDGYAQTSPVDAMAANPMGVHDIAGNVWQWLYDWEAPYTADEQTDPTGAENGTKRCLRGGGWWNHGWDVNRCSNRDGDYPNFTFNHTGFRLAHNLYVK